MVLRSHTDAYEETRAALEWRWKWLQAQMAQVQTQRDQLLDQYKRIRKVKHKIIPLSTAPAWDSRAARCAPLKLPKKHRKLVRVSKVSLDPRLTTPSAEQVRQHPLAFCKGAASCVAARAATFAHVSVFAVSR